MPLHADNCSVLGGCLCTNSVATYVNSTKVLTHSELAAMNAWQNKWSKIPPDGPKTITAAILHLHQVVEPCRPALY